VKVLDFGLAKLADSDGPAKAGHDVPGGGGRLQPDLSASPTITSPAMMTTVGVSGENRALMAVAVSDSVPLRIKGWLAPKPGEADQDRGRWIVPTTETPLALRRVFRLALLSASVPVEA